MTTDATLRSPDPQAFHDALWEFKLGFCWGFFLKGYSVSDYARWTLRADESLRCGFAVTETGEINSLWRRHDAALSSDQLVDAAIALGGHWLNCFDNGVVPALYARHGFHITERYPFDPALKIAEWDEAAVEAHFGHQPDFLRMDLHRV